MKLALLASGVKENCPKMDQLESIDFLKIIGPLSKQVLSIVPGQETGVLCF